MLDLPKGYSVIEKNGAPGVTGAGPRTTLATIKIPSGRRGVIEKLMLNSADYDVATFTILLNGNPVAGYEDVDSPVGESGIATDTHIDIPAGSKLEVVCVHSGDAGVRYRLFGYEIPL